MTAPLPIWSSRAPTDFSGWHGKRLSFGISAPGQVHGDFLINGARVGSFDDTSVVAGQVGLVANTNDDCVFTNLVITRA